MSITEMLKQDWELCLKDWGRELSLEVITEVFQSESGSFNKSVVVHEIQGVMMHEIVKPLNEKQVVIPEREREFLLDRELLPAGVSLLECNLVVDELRYEIVTSEEYVAYIRVGCRKVTG